MRSVKMHLQLSLCHISEYMQDEAKSAMEACSSLLRPWHRLLGCFQLLKEIYDNIQGKLESCRCWLRHRSLTRGGLLMQAAAAAAGGAVPESARGELLSEVAALVEAPTVLAGRFDATFLALPRCKAHTV